jgi:inorganic triphosphatase YgiF
MTNFSHTSSEIEIEAKFTGGEEERERIAEWFEEHGFRIEHRPPVHRVHIYFDDQDRLRTSGCRLRCIIAPGEWCRYDFKADDPSGRHETNEISLKMPHPIPLPEAVSDLAASLSESAAKSALLDVRDAVGIVLVTTGTHQKFIATGKELELEISWDVLIPIETGVPLSEIEIEILHGPRSGFDACIDGIEQILHLKRSHISKLEAAMRKKTL